MSPVTKCSQLYHCCQKSVTWIPVTQVCSVTEDEDVPRTRHTFPPPILPCFISIMKLKGTDLDACFVWLQQTWPRLWKENQRWAIICLKEKKSSLPPYVHSLFSSAMASPLHTFLHKTISSHHPTSTQLCATSSPSISFDWRWTLIEPVPMICSQVYFCFQLMQ